MYDVIVVGARCAGAPTAMLLADKGWRVLLLDRDPFPSNMPLSTHLVHPTGVAYLRRWGIHEDVAATSTCFTRWRVDLHGFVLDGEPPEVDGSTVHYAPRRQILDALLARAAVDAGAELRDRTRVTGLEFDGPRVTGVRAVDLSGRSYTESARIVVGADGPASIVARSVGARESHVEPIVQSNLWTYWRKLPVDHLRLYFREHAGAFAIPSSDRTVLVAANLMYEDFVRARPDREGAYYAMLERVAPDLRELVASAEQADQLFAGCTRAFVRETQGPGWALVGDASMKKDPVTAQGISVAFEYADKLARAIDAGLSGAQDLAVALAEYERERDERLMPYYHFTARLAHFEAPTPGEARLYERLQDDPDGTSQLFGAVTLTVSPEVVLSAA